MNSRKQTFRNNARHEGGGRVGNTLQRNLHTGSHKETFNIVHTKSYITNNRVPATLHNAASFSLKYITKQHVFHKQISMFLIFVFRQSYYQLFPSSYH